jgi:LacI family transcriptional regulator
MMRGDVRAARCVPVAAVGVVTRRSTDVVAVNDTEVSTAMSFIRTAQGNQLSVGDVADSVVMSRRELEKRFRTVLGCAILDEIDCAHRGRKAPVSGN